MRSVEQGVTLFTAVCLLIGTLVVIQLWLLAASVESLFRGDRSTLVPATIGSAVLAAINAAILAAVTRFDRRIKHPT